MNELNDQIKILFKKYVELDTSLESGIHYLSAIKLLEKYLNKKGYKAKIHKIPKKYTGGKPNRFNLVARKFVNTEFPTLLIYNHIDVVPAEYESAFKFREEKDCYYGRGTSDHKGGTIAVLDALDKILDKDLKYNIILWFTTDEETSQIDQLDYMTKKLELPKNTLVFDTDTFAGGITIARLGLLDIEIKVNGKSTHSAMSNLGSNPIEASAHLINYLIQLRNEHEKTKSQHKAFKSSGLDYVVNRCNVTMINSGISPNTIPEQAILAVNCRFIPEANVEKESKSLISKIKKFAYKNKIEIDIKVKNKMQGYGDVNKYSKEFSRIYKKHNKESGLYCILGSCDLSAWVKERGLPHFALGVARGDTNVHGINEFVYKQDIINLSNSFTEFVSN